MRLSNSKHWLSQEAQIQINSILKYEIEYNKNTKLKIWQNKKKQSNE
jgi:hypothetical protein